MSEAKKQSRAGTHTVFVVPELQTKKMNR